MGFVNPGISWGELERRLSDRPSTGRVGDLRSGDGSDSPAWSRKRVPYTPPSEERRRGEIPYAELHCHSNFSFLDGASILRSWPRRQPGSDSKRWRSPTTTASTVWSGSPRQPKQSGCRPFFGAELTLSPSPEADRSGSTRQAPIDLRRSGPADPEGEHILILARGPEGYARLGRAISEGQLAGEKGAPRIPYERLVELAGDGTGDHWAVLTACRKGSVPAALAVEGPAAGAARTRTAGERLRPPERVRRTVGSRSTNRFGSQRCPRRTRCVVWGRCRRYRQCPSPLGRPQATCLGSGRSACPAQPR